MSPSKSRGQFIPARPRSEVVTAVLVGAAIVLGTALLIWLLRPGTPGVPGGGGLLSRQPRMTILVVATAVVLAAVAYRVLTHHKRSARLSQRGELVLGSTVVIVLAVAGGIFWPGGVVRHWPKRPKLVQTPPTTAAPASTTTAKSATTAKTATTVAPTSSVPSNSSTPTTTG
jgi:uncharacterized membrane protein YfcA